jgi:hypothetical protein
MPTMPRPGVGPGEATVLDGVFVQRSYLRRYCILA